MQHVPAGNVFVLEPSPRWVPELQRQWQKGEFNVEGSRDVASWVRSLSGERSGSVSDMAGRLSDSRVFTPPTFPLEGSFAETAGPGDRVSAPVASPTRSGPLARCGLYVLAYGGRPLLSQLQIWNVRRDVPPIVVVAERQHSDLQWALYEAGVVHVAYEPISGSQMARLIARLLQPKR